MTTTSRRSIEPEDILKFVTIQDVQISPDGSRVAYVLSRVEAEADEYRSAIWIVPADGGEPVQFTAGAKRDSMPRWSPDGTQIAFLSNREEKPQLYLISASGGESRRLTNLPDGAGMPFWSPDGNRIAFAAGVQREPAPADAKAKERWQQRPRHVDLTQYKRDGAGYTYAVRSHIFIVSVDGGEPKQVTDGLFDDYDPTWSPDGRTIAFCSARHETREFDLNVDLFLMPAEGGEPRSIARLDRISAPAFSPDGRTIAVYAGVGDGRDWIARLHLWLVPAEGGEVRDLVADLDRSVSVLPPPIVSPRPAWSANGSELLFPIMDRGNVELDTVSVLDGRRRRVLTGERQVHTWSLAAPSGRLAFVFTDLETPSDLATIGLDGSRERRLTRANEALLAELDFRPLRRRRFTTPHGEIEGFVSRADAATGPGPLLLTIHGGPHGAYGTWFPLMEWHWLAAAARGWTVVGLNPTGSGSYGDEFARALVGQWGEYDLPELMAVVDTLVAEGIADPDRLAVTGYSYGGYMTSWVVGHTNRFKAAVIGAPVTNLESMHGTSDIGWGFPSSEMGGPLVKNREAFRRLSPVTYLDQVTTPCLILHGEADDRCPIGQGEEFFVGLRVQGKPAEMVRYPGASHLFILNGRPSHRVDYAQRLLAWIERHVIGQPKEERELATAGD